MVESVVEKKLVAKPWDFQSVFNFMDACRVHTEAAKEEGTAPTNIQIRRASSGTKLGDFNRLLADGGNPGVAEPKVALPRSEAGIASTFNTQVISEPIDIKFLDTYEASSLCSNSCPESIGTTPPSSAPKDLDSLERLMSKSRFEWDDGQTSSANRMKHNKEAADSKRRQQVIRRTVFDQDVSFLPIVNHVSPVKTKAKASFKPASFLASESETEPHSRLGPVLQPTCLYAQANISHDLVKPRCVWSREGQSHFLSQKLGHLFEDVPPSIAQQGGNISAEGIHIFVDASNIVISFFEKLKQDRGIDRTRPVGNTLFNFHSLAMIMERGRPVARRVLAGSHRATLDSAQPKRPTYLIEAEACGYEINLLERVLKTKACKQANKRHSNGNGYATISGHTSGDEKYGSAPRVMAEQAVDEVLHMKLLESLVDTAIPSTIVLASGDAAEAEYSGGFLKNVERALMKGWKVELLAWKDNLGQEYRSSEFLRRWTGQFQILELDDFLEELLALYAFPYCG